MVSRALRARIKKGLTIDDFLNTFSGQALEFLMQDKIDDDIEALVAAYGRHLIRNEYKGRRLNKKIVKGGNTDHHYELGKLSIFLKRRRALTVEQRRNLSRIIRCHIVNGNGLGISGRLFSVTASKINNVLSSCNGPGDYRYIFDFRGQYLGIVCHTPFMSYRWVK